MLDPNELRSVANFGIGTTLCLFGLLMIWRGAHEQYWWAPIPGRIVCGLFLLLLGIDRLLVATIGIVVDIPARRTEIIESWFAVYPLLICFALSVWTLTRFTRNTLGVQPRGAVAEQTERIADETARVADETARMADAVEVMNGGTVMDWDGSERRSGNERRRPWRKGTT